MKRIFVFLNIFIMLCSSAVAIAQSTQMQEPRFFTAFEDVPLMAGMVELPEHIVTYDKPEGRIIESVALMNSLQRDEIVQFYRMTLPQMGWGVVSDTQYFRKEEYLDMSFDALGEQKIVRVMIRPAL